MGLRRGRALAAGQGFYFLATGLWPLVSLRTFMAVTGPKVDGWLVKTVGVLVAVIGTALLVGARRDPPSSETAVLAAGAAAGLGAVDAIYALRGRISRIYLLDAVLEGLLLAAWAALSGTALAPRAAGEERRPWPSSSKARGTRRFAG